MAHSQKQLKTLHTEREEIKMNKSNNRLVLKSEATVTTEAAAAAIREIKKIKFQSLRFRFDTQDW